MDVRSPQRERERDRLARLASELHACGAPADDLEAAVRSAGRALGHEVEVFASPTVLQLAFGGRSPTTRLLRVSPGGINLARLADLQAWIEQLEAGASRAEARRAFSEIVEAPNRYGSKLELLAFAGASATAAPLFGGGPMEVLVAALLGMLTGLLARSSASRPELARLLAPLAAGGAALAVAALAGWFPLAADSVILSALIVLVPGFTVTVALRELAGGHLVSGTARLAGGTITLMGLGLGVAVGRTFAEQLWPAPAVVEPVGLGEAWTWVALSIAPLCFAVLFQARRRDFAGIVAVALTGFVLAREGSDRFGPQLGTYLGAFGVGLAGELLAFAFRRSAAVYTVPGILLLVPGSIGFRSIASFLDADVVGGVDGAFRMIMIGAALATGLLSAGALRAAVRGLRASPGPRIDPRPRGPAPGSPRGAR